VTSSELWPGRVRAAFADTLGDEGSVEEGFGPLAVEVPVSRWVDAAVLARDGLGCRFFDFLTAVDEQPEGFRVVCHVAAHRSGAVDHLLLLTLVTEQVPSLAKVYAGARWHERETAEMFGVVFTVDGEAVELEGLLLPEGFEGHPLRKDFVLASRVAKPWPGAKEPGESDHGGAPSRRRTRPPGVPEDWPRTAAPPVVSRGGSAAPQPPEGSEGRGE
jgi:NADH-quinone oxidoreductase subunit C